MARLIKKTNNVEKLKEQIKENTTATIGNKAEQKVVVEGQPLDHHPKHAVEKTTRTVGVSVGSTINMGDFQSLRVDCWITDELLDNETQTEGLKRLTDVASEHLRYMAEELAN